MTDDRTPDRLVIPKADDYLTSNDRLHEMARYRLEQAWQQAAYLVACSTLGRSPAARRRPPATVHVTLPFASKRRRDAHNFTATIKPVIDGLVKADVWPDDTGEFVRTTEATLVVVPRGAPLDVIVILNYGPTWGNA